MEIFVTVMIALGATVLAIFSQYTMNTTKYIDDIKQNIAAVIGYVAPIVLMICIVYESAIAFEYKDVIDAQARTISNTISNDTISAIDKQEVQILKDLRVQYATFISEYHDLAFLSENGHILLDSITYNEYKLDSLEYIRRK